MKKQSAYVTWQSREIELRKELQKNNPPRGLRVMSSEEKKRLIEELEKAERHKRQLSAGSAR